MRIAGPVKSRLAPLAFAALLPGASPASAQVRAEDALAKSRALTSPAPCKPQPAGEIVVCARDREREAERYRLPLSEERSADPQIARRGEAGHASLDTASARECGIFKGQRRCGKDEALRYGYGGGQDPLSAAIKIGTSILDPDADVAPPVQVPKRFGNMPE